MDSIADTLALLVAGLLAIRTASWLGHARRRTRTGINAAR
jgi:hypothetical protein